MPEPNAPTAFAEELARVARQEHDRFHGIDEGDEPLRSRIREYWEATGFPFPGVETPWSAVFISFCVKKAGAKKAEFAFNSQHSVFVHKAIRDAEAGTGVFHGVKITEEAPSVGDIIQNNRTGSTHDFAFARKDKDYASHTAIVVARGVDANGKFVFTIGGNEGDSVRSKRVPLTEDGLIRQRAKNPFICLIKTRKP